MRAPALRDTYLLEQHVAGYPRIVVGDSLADFLRHSLEKQGDDLWIKLNREVASECIATMGRDHDGVYYVDHLNARVWEQWCAPGDFRKQMEEGYAFVKAEHERFVAARNQQKLAGRYALLRRYYEVRIGDYGAGDGAADSQ